MSKNSEERPPSDLMLPSEVANLFRVSPKTVARWAGAGKLKVRKTLGNHRRYVRSEVEELLAKQCEGDARGE